MLHHAASLLDDYILVFAGVDDFVGIRRVECAVGESCVDDIVDGQGRALGRSDADVVKLDSG